MLDNLMNWIKQIIYLLIFLTLLIELLPQKSYGKYVRFFAGLVFVAALITPVASLFAGGDRLDRLEQSVEEEIQEFETATDADDADLDDMDLDSMEEVQSSLYENFAKKYANEAE